jgi:hypothetical protein
LGLPPVVHHHVAWVVVMPQTQTLQTSSYAGQVMECHVMCESWRKILILNSDLSDLQNPTKHRHGHLEEHSTQVPNPFGQRKRRCQHMLRNNLNCYQKQ